MKFTYSLIILVLFFFSCISNHKNMKIDINVYKMFFKNNFKVFNVIGYKIDSLKLNNVPFYQYSQYLNPEIEFKNLDGTKSVGWVKVDSLNVNSKTVYIEVNMPKIRSNCTSFCFIYRINARYLKNNNRNVEYEMLGNNWFLTIDNSNPCIE
jgi:hypothetical protein